MQHLQARARWCWETTSHFWDALHVERHGKYSLERLCRLVLYSERTSLLRAAAVMLLTPLPCILTAIAADVAPLEPPERGLAHSHMFWVRATCIAWCISFGVLDECRHFVVRLPMTSAQVLGVNMVVVGMSVAIMYGLAKVIGFPLPFFQVTIAPGWLVILVLCIVLVWGKHFKDDPPMKHEMAHYAMVVATQASLALVYLAYISLFRKLSGSAQVAFAFFLPAMKMLAKIVMDRLLRDLDDAKPEFITFNVEAFHALFVTCCMQNATSYLTTIILVVVDSVLAIRSIHKILLVVRSLDDLVAENQDKGDGLQVPGGGDARRAPTKLHFIEAAIFLLENDPKLLQDSVIRVQSHETIESVASKMLSKPTKIRTPGADDSRRIPKAPHSNAAVVPFATGSKQDQAQASELLADLADADKRAVLTLSDADRAWFVQQVLHFLHRTEFFLLVEFTEVVIPIVYCVYVSVAFDLPKKVYYPQLRDMDESSFRASINNILVYAGLEAASLVFLALMLQRKLRISALRQLTFVLETQWRQVQPKLVMWTAFALQLPPDHFGMDFSFQLAWLRKTPPAAT